MKRIAVQPCASQIFFSLTADRRRSFRKKIKRHREFELPMSKTKLEELWGRVEQARDKVQNIQCEDPDPTIEVSSSPEQVNRAR